jgi:hypothetical protein
MSLANKLLSVYLGLEFLNGFKKQSEKQKEIKNSYLANEIVNCKIYQDLVAEGKSPEQISKILNLKNMDAGRFFELTGKHW